MNVLDLFSGIGGFSLGLERAGMRTVAFCEIEPYARAVLAKHWPGVPCYDDVRTLTANRLRAAGIIPDVVCGGFPCQDISRSGKMRGIKGEQSGLWSEFARHIDECRPAFAIIENVAALLGRGLRTVLSDLWALGYDAEWHCIPAYYIGAAQERDRIWIVAYPMCQGEAWRRAGWLGWGHGCEEEIRSLGWPRDAAGHVLLDAEPAVDRITDAAAKKLDTYRSQRVNAIGNAVVPDIPELIGRSLMRLISTQPST